MRKYYGWGHFDELAKDMKLKQSKPKERVINEEKRKSQREKFLKCKSCGGQRMYIAGTNCLICNCVVDKEKTNVIKDKYGNVIEKRKETIQAPCGEFDIIKPEFQDYVKYLFG